ncbi:MAG: endonuclease III [Nitrospira sp.]|nr:endonuclease III [Nitrospira sp.]
MRTGKERPASTRSIKQRVARILPKLHKAMPNAKVELDHRNPLQLLIATILSAQCTDQRVNQVTPALFRRYTEAVDYARADPSELETIIMPTGFYKSKTRSLIGTGKMLLERFGGKVPRSMEELVQLPGVGRKTANVLLGNCFGQPAVVVDTHVKRVAHRLGLTESEDPEVIEQDLQRVMPLDQWTLGSERLLLHGRYICVAKGPKCEQCPIYGDCSWEGKQPR